MSPTIRDVAREAAVSVATVSRAINGKENVSENTLERVTEVIRRLGYVPHSGARSLTTRRTGVIGVVLPEMHGDFFSEIIRGIDRVARPEGYHVLVSGSHSDLSETEEVLQALHGRIDGVILMMPGPGGERLVESLPRKVAAVLLNAPGNHESYDTLNVDNRLGARLAVNHLLAHGHRRIALICGPEGNADAQDRRAGYREALTAHGLEIDPRLELRGDFREQSGFEAGLAATELSSMPSAAFAANDAMAIGCLAALRKRGLRVPEDISLVGFDDIPIARYLKPALTTVRVPIAEVGEQAMKRLLTTVNEEASPRWTHSVTPTLSIRESTTILQPANHRLENR